MRCQNQFQWGDIHGIAAKDTISHWSCCNDHRRSWKRRAGLGWFLKKRGFIGLRLPKNSISRVGIFIVKMVVTHIFLLRIVIPKNINQKKHWFYYNWLIQLDPFSNELNPFFLSTTRTPRPLFALDFHGLPGFYSEKSTGEIGPGSFVGALGVPLLFGFLGGGPHGVTPWSGPEVLMVGSVTSGIHSPGWGR